MNFKPWFEANENNQLFSTIYKIVLKDLILVLKFIAIGLEKEKSDLCF
jgi:hypothetical protein